MEKFNFKEDLSMFVGIERESFLTNLGGEIIPVAPNVLELLTDRKRFGYELSACQLEDRIGPCVIDDVAKELMKNEKEINAVVEKLHFCRMHKEVAPENMPLDVYPDPTGRYQEIASKISKDILLAACRVIGTHVHVGMPNHETALRVYNQVSQHWERLAEIGDGSAGERLRIYKLMADNYIPPRYASWADFYENAIEKGFVLDPRRCWNLIRISVHGTIEFRMFGATGNPKEVARWARECHELCNFAIG